MAGVSLAYNLNRVVTTLAAAATTSVLSVRTLCAGRGRWCWHAWRRRRHRGLIRLIRGLSAARRDGAAVLRRLGRCPRAAVATGRCQPMALCRPKVGGFQDLSAERGIHDGPCNGTTLVEVQRCRRRRRLPPRRIRDATGSSGMARVRCHNVTSSPPQAVRGRKQTVRSSHLGHVTLLLLVARSSSDVR